METWKLIVLLLPVIVIQFTLMIVAIIDLAKREQVRYDNKVIWAVVIVLINLIGPIVYLIWGREPEG